MQDTSLSVQQKASRVADLKKHLPDSLRDTVAMSEMAQSLDEVQADWKKRGGTPDELRLAREQLVGKDGADRLEALDRENSAWDARMSAYLSQRTAILSDQTLADDLKRKQVDLLRNQSFVGPDQIRVEALEKLHDDSKMAGNTDH